MAHAEGAYLGGVRTLADLRERCRVDPETGCWHWRLSMSQGTPRVHVRDAAGRKTSMRGRRAALMLARGKDSPKGHQAFARAACDAEDCVNPEHCQSASKAERWAQLAASGVLKGSLERRAQVTRMARSSPRVKLSLEKAREIRQCDDPIEVQAQRYGVSRFAIWRVLRGKGWLETGSGASVFALGGAPVLKGGVR